MSFPIPRDKYLLPLPSPDSVEFSQVNKKSFELSSSQNCAPHTLSKS